MSNYRKTMTEALREMYSLDESVIDKVKEIDKRKSAKKIDGVMVDSFTASAISQVYDKVNAANKKKMEKLPIKKLADLAMKFIKHGEEFVPEEVELDEGTWELPRTSKQKAGLKKALSKPIKLGKEGETARNVIGPFIGDDELFDDLMDAGDENPKSDARPIIKKAMKRLGIKEEVELDEADDFKPHMMYDPKTGKGYKADTMDDHLRMKKMGYTHDAPQKEEVELDENEGLKNKSEKSGISVGILKKVYNRGLAAYKTGHRPGTTAPQWAMARVNSFITKGSGTWGGADKDLAKQTEAVDPADIDTSATDDDIKSADKNIMMQMRKAVSLRGQYPVEFLDKKKVKIPQKMAQAVIDKYNKQKKPIDKEKFQAKIAKSYKSLMMVVKEQKEETLLDRMNRKILENNNG